MKLSPNRILATIGPAPTLMLAAGAQLQSEGARDGRALGMHRTRSSVALLCALAALLLPRPIEAASASVTTVPRPDHVVVVVEENHSATNIIGNPDAPFI